MIRFSVGERMVIASAVLLYLYFHCIRLTHWAKARRRKWRRLWMIQNNFNVLCIFNGGKDNWTLSLSYSPLYKIIKIIILKGSFTLSWHESDMASRCILSEFSFSDSNYQWSFSLSRSNPNCFCYRKLLLTNEKLILSSIHDK